DLIHERVAGRSGYGTTAYVAWAVFGDEPSGDSGPTREYLLSVRPEEVGDVYDLALACNALLALDPTGELAGPYLRRLERLQKGAGKVVWWEQGEKGRTIFYGSGRCGDVETTALAVLALVRAGRSPGTVNAALSWLVAQKDPRGTWYSTQATVLALKALVAATRQQAAERERLVRIKFGNGFPRDPRIPAGQS